MDDVANVMLMTFLDVGAQYLCEKIESVGDKSG